MHPRAEELISKLELQPHPEGGFYRRLYESPTRVMSADDRGDRAALTTTYFLLSAEIFSRWHRVRSDEVWHLYEGGPLELLEMDSSASSLERYVLGPLGGAQQSPVHVVAAGQWQAARSLGDYTLIGCTVAPGFDWNDFTLLADDETAAAKVRKELSEVAFLI